MVLITKKSYKVIQKLKKKAYKKKSYYYNLRKSITSETLMPIISKNFAFTLINQDLSNSKKNL